MQKRFGNLLKGALFAAVASASAGAWATPTWTTGGIAPADWRPLNGNVLLNVKGTTASDGVPGYTSGNAAVLTDGQVPTATPDKPGIFGFRNNETISWIFAAPQNLSQIRICSCYLTGASYDGVHVAKVEVSYNGGASWVQIAGDAEYKGGSQGNINYALLSDGDNPVAQNVTGLKVTFGTCESGFANYYAEIEAVGTTGATGPVLGTVTVSPGKTKATLAGRLVDLGTDATACDVYLSLSGAAAAKIAEGMTDAFSYTITNLTAGTTYTYELTVANNATPSRQTVGSGDFTTLSADAVTATWTTGEGVPADWEPLENNLLANLPGTTTGSVSGYGGGAGLLTDGQVSGVTKQTCGLGNGTSVEWTFSVPKTLEKIRVTSCDIPDGRQYDDLKIADVLVKTADSAEWTSLGCGALNWSGSNGAGIMIYATLEDAETGCLAENVAALKVVSGTPNNVAQYYAEIEAACSAAVTGPILGAFGVTPAKTKAVLAGTLADVGTGATSCDVYLSLDGAAATRIATGVTDAFSYTITNLTPCTTYAYELSVSNNAETARGTVRSGDFTTLSNEVSTASWAISDYVPGVWTSVRGNLLANRTPSASSGVSGYANKDVMALVDGVAPTEKIASTVVGFTPGGMIAWGFEEAKTIESLRISSLWEGQTYNGISIKDVEILYADDPGTWISLTNSLPMIEWRGGAADGQCAVLSDAEAGYLAEGVVGLRLTFGKQKAAVANYYAEIEAIGYASEGEASAPTFTAPATVETPLATKAVFSAELSSIGGRARYATLSFAIGPSLQALGTPELLSDNAFPGETYSTTLTNLVPNTTYYYSFFAQNDVVDTVVTNAGFFTTPRLKQVSCVYNLAGGNVSVQVGGETHSTSGSYSVDQGEEISITALPASGYEFLYWDSETLAPSKVSDNPLSLVMLDDCELTPVVRLIGSSSENIHWLGNEGSWRDASQWDVGRVPTAGDNVFIAGGVCTAPETASAKSLTISATGVLVVAEPNSGAYGNLTVSGNLTLSGTAELHVAAGPTNGVDRTFATGCGFVTVGGTFALADAAKFIPCCDQYTGGGVVTTAKEFILGADASVEARSLGFARFKDRDPASLALGAGTDYGHGASYGGYGDTWSPRGLGVAPYGFANAPVHPGSHKYDKNNPNDTTAGGGNVRIHAGRAALEGKVDVSANVASSQGASSGGGIWITAESLKIEPTAVLLAQGAMTENEGFGHGNGAGGRIAIGHRIPADRVAALAEDGELPTGCSAFELDDFLEVFPGVTVNVNPGHDAEKEPEPLATCCGTFRYVLGPIPATILLIR